MKANPLAKVVLFLHDGIQLVSDSQSGITALSPPPDLTPTRPQVSSSATRLWSSPAQKPFTEEAISVWPSILREELSVRKSESMFSVSVGAVVVVVMVVDGRWRPIPLTLLDSTPLERDNRCHCVIECIYLLRFAGL